MKAAVMRAYRSPLTLEEVVLDEPGPGEVLVRTVAMFELTFLVAGPDSQTLIVALYSAAFTPGIRAAQAIDAMAVMYTMLSSVLLVLALSFVNPTQIVAQVKEVAPE